MFESLISTFSSKPGPNDAITATTLNVTKIGSFLALLGSGTAALAEAFGTGVVLTSGQWVALALGVLAFVALLMATDMAVRAYATVHERVIVNVKGVKTQVWAHGAGHGSTNPRVKDGSVEALMMTNGSKMVLVRDKTTGTATWEAIDDTDLQLASR